MFRYVNRIVRFCIPLRGFIGVNVSAFNFGIRSARRFCARRSRLECTLRLSSSIHSAEIPVRFALLRFKHHNQFQVIAPQRPLQRSFSFHRKTLRTRKERASTASV